MENNDPLDRTEKKERVIVISRKMLWTFISIILFILIITSVLALLLVNKSSEKTTSSSAINSSATSTDKVFSLVSDAGADGEILPIEYTCDGSSSSPALSWSNIPDGTKEFALMMSTIPVDGSTKWSWVVYGIPTSTASIEKNNKTVGTTGVGSHKTIAEYQPPCSQGPGLNKYTFTLYALSASPELPDDPLQVTGEVLTKAISNITLDSANLNLHYQRFNAE